jgi:hypothetical protein
MRVATAIQRGWTVLWTSERRPRPRAAALLLTGLRIKHLPDMVSRIFLLFLRWARWWWCGRGLEAVLKKNFKGQ